MDDERLKKELEVDLVGSRPLNREGDRGKTEAREKTEEELLEQFRQTMYTDALPDLPNIEGYHVCWLSTAHPNDPIHRRLQQGYALITAEDVPGLAYTSLKTGEFAGCIGVNEMIAAKLPMSLYQGFMNIAHHERPRDAEEAIISKRQEMIDQARGHKMHVEEFEGDADMRQSAPSRGIFK